MYTILIVEDDVLLCDGLKMYLEDKGFRTLCASTVKKAEDTVRNMGHNISLMLLDCSLPDGDGVVFCRRIRQEYELPVIFLTARDTDEEMIEGFRAGADDYIAKPFSINVLYERIMAVLRRSKEESTKQLFQYKELMVDMAKRKVFREGEELRLSGTEYRILELLIQNRRQVLTRDMLLQKIWDCNENYVDENTLNVYIRRIRQKLEKDPGKPEYVITVFGIGYTFGR